VRSVPSWKTALALVVGGLCASALLVELGLRALTNSLFDWGELHHWDPVVGRMYRPGVAWRHPAKGFTFTIEPHGVRANGAPPPAGPPILAVGDSFTFGENVDDRDTWPAVLEQLTGVRVINGGVPGFGIDQTVLRAEQLHPIFSPDRIVVSFIPLDVQRGEMSISGHPKPYFEITDDGLALQPAPAVAQKPMRRLLARSVAAELLFSRALRPDGPEYLLVHRRGVEVACLLMERLAALDAGGPRVVILAQPQAPVSDPADVAIKDAVLDCARAGGLATLDLFPHIEAVAPAQRVALFETHMTAAGNRLVAERLAEFLAGIPADDRRDPAGQRRGRPWRRGRWIPLQAA